MTDVYCILAGLIRLLSPLLLLIYWHKRTGARFFPALIAFPVCFPVFILGNAIRSGFHYSTPISYYIQQGLLFGVLEECTKYIMMRFILTDYDDRRDAVTYGIGHGAYEEMLAAFTCFGLFGKGTAGSAILLVAVWSVIEGTVSVCANTVMILYGIRTGKTRIMLPAAIAFHAAGNAVLGIFIEPVAVPLATALTAAELYIAVRCWKAMQIPEVNDKETRSASDNL